MKKVLVIAAVIGLAFGSSAYASPITLSTTGVVGVLDLHVVTDPDNNGYNDGNTDAYRLVIANQLLSMLKNQVWTDPVPDNQGDYRRFYTSSTEYSAVLSGGTTVTGTNVLPGMYEYVLAKYDGPNGGYVLFYGPAWNSLTIPSSAGFAYWDGGVSHEYGLSGWTGYNYIPDGGSVAMMLGAALMGLAGLRRFLN
jgi:hypothetical protein